MAATLTAAALAASSLGPTQVARELRRIGLRFGQLPDWLVPRLAELWTAHRGQGAKGDDLVAVAAELPGGWQPKQVGRLSHRRFCHECRADGTANSPAAIAVLPLTAARLALTLSPLMAEQCARTQHIT
jgi:hypothetical protein